MRRSDWPVRPFLKPYNTHKSQLFVFVFFLNTYTVQMNVSLIGRYKSCTNFLGSLPLVLFAHSRIFESSVFLGWTGGP